MDGILNFETCSFMEKELKKRSRKVKPEKREFDGWGSKSLRDFLKSIGKDSNDPISQNEVTVIIQKYVQENKLIHPVKKRKILCDTKLHSIFSRKYVHVKKIYDFLERHFAENLEESDENEWSYSSDEMAEGSSMSCKKQRKTSLSKSIDEKQKVSETRRSCFASVTVQNIKRIYLKRSLIEEFLKNPVSFDEKVTECFVRVKSDPNDYFQKNAYQLLQVKGITKVPGNDIKEEVTLHVSNSKKTFRIGMLSDEDFSEEEIEDLNQRVKDGLHQKLNIVDLERKAHSLHEDLTKHERMEAMTQQMTLESGGCSATNGVVLTNVLGPATKRRERLQSRVEPKGRARVSVDEIREITAAYIERTCDLDRQFDERMRELERRRDEEKTRELERMWEQLNLLMQSRQNQQAPPPPPSPSNTN